VIHYISHENETEFYKYPLKQLIAWQTGTQSTAHESHRYRLHILFESYFDRRSRIQKYFL